MSSVTETFNHIVVGGGIVGLAVAARLSAAGSSILLLERHRSLISETSSRNSGVIHAGIYYPKESLKTKLSIKGNRFLWKIRERFPGSLLADRCGKMIGAVVDAEVERVRQIAEYARTLGAPGAMLSSSQIQQLEPDVKMKFAFLSTSTGIVDVHSLADYYRFLIEKNQASLIALGQRVVQVETAKGSPISVRTSSGDVVFGKTLINCGGLYSNEVRRLCLEGLGVPPEKMVCLLRQTQQHYCRGRYAVLIKPKGLVKRLVYPCPLPNLKGLGTHATIDLAGNVLFGPDAVYVDELEPSELQYGFGNDTTQQEFLTTVHQAVVRYIPKVDRRCLSLGYIGYRPKLSAEGEPFRDFWICSEEDSSIITLAGIESPGLTASSAIADHVAEMLNISRPPEIEWPHI